MAATVVVAVVGVTAPAQAGAPGYTRQGIYGWGDQCLGIGYYGQTQGRWTSYYCQTITPSGATGPGSYELWVA